jgi:hypothetical protein
MVEMKVAEVVTAFYVSLRLQTVLPEEVVAVEVITMMTRILVAEEGAVEQATKMIVGL